LVQFHFERESTERPILSISDVNNPKVKAELQKIAEAL